VTHKHVDAVSGKAYSPDQSLIQRYATTYAWKKENLLAVLSEFGPLSEAGQEQLIRCLVLAFGPYQLVAKAEKRITPREQQNQLKAIEKTAERLLQQLDDRFVKMWLATAGVVTADRDEVAVNAELRKANDRMTDAVCAIKDLRDRAKTAAQAASKRVIPGRGGSRRRSKAKGRLIKDAILIYSHMRMQHPDSGRRPGFGGPMQRFVHAVAKLFGDRVQDAHIRDVWRMRKSKQKQF
jgi:hypothetical protein